MEIIEVLSKVVQNRYFVHFCTKPFNYDSHICDSDFNDSWNNTHFPEPVGPALATVLTHVVSDHLIPFLISTWKQIIKWILSEASHKILQIPSLRKETILSFNQHKLNINLSRMALVNDSNLVNGKEIKIMLRRLLMTLHVLCLEMHKCSGDVTRKKPNTEA